MYDNVCKFLAEQFSSDIAKWLLGEAIPMTELSPSELSLEPIRADSIMLLASTPLVLHVEFQTKPIIELLFRMLDYRVRVYRRYPDKQMRQVVVYLTRSNSPLVMQNSFNLEKTRHEFEVIRLWEQPTEMFLTAPGLLPFAVLSQTDNPTAVLTQVAAEIDKIEDKRVQANVTGTAAILAGLVLEKQPIGQILRREIMRESVVYQEILQEGEEKGLQKGVQLGVERLEQAARNLLASGMAVEQVANLIGLPLERVRSLQGSGDS